METNLTLKVEDLTPDFADGMRKLFSANATLFIRVEYGGSISGGSQSTSPAAAGKKVKGRRGRPPKATSSAFASSDTAPKKRGRKPGQKSKLKVPGIPGAAPKKRGRPAKNA